VTIIRVISPITEVVRVAIPIQAHAAIASLHCLGFCAGDGVNFDLCVTSKESGWPQRDMPASCVEAIVDKRGPAIV
jgi:hypothetical protein